MQKFILICEQYASSVLRLSMGAVILWFSFNQLLFPEIWSAYIPDYAVNISNLNAITLVYINAIFELVFGIFLIIGWQVRISALLLSLHLIEIAIVVGYGETLIRDFGLACGLFVVFMNGSDILSSDKNYMENKSNKKGFSISILIIVLIILIAVFAGRKDDDDAVSQIPATTLDSTINASTKYKDGIYSAIGTYNSPGGINKVEFSITLLNNKITDSSIITKQSDKTSDKYIKIFSENYKGMIIGKDISEVKLDKVSGSSLTSAGFNDAIIQIKNKAKI